MPEPRPIAETKKDIRMRPTLLLLLPVFAALAADTGRQRVDFAGAPATRTDAIEHVREMAARNGVKAPGVAGIYLYKSYRTEHNGVTHNIFRQRFQGADVRGMEWVVNADRDGNLLNSGGRLIDAPAAGAKLPAEASANAAARAAVKAVDDRIQFLPSATRLREGRAGGVAFAAGPLGAEVLGEMIWYR